MGLATDASHQIFVSLVAIGASMGGVEAVERVLRMMPAWSPPTLIVQHMPAPFVPPYAHRLDGLSAMDVRVALEPTPLRRGLALIAPGDRHLVVRWEGPELYAVPIAGPRVNLHRPAVGVLFDAVAQVVGAPAVGVILTGMGSDGAEGLAAMRQAGARTIAQDAATSVVHGMPGVAISLGAAERIEPLDRVAASILELATEPPPSPIAPSQAAVS